MACLPAPDPTPGSNEQPCVPVERPIRGRILGRGLAEGRGRHDRFLRVFPDLILLVFIPRSAEEGISPRRAVVVQITDPPWKLAVD